MNIVIPCAGAGRRYKEAGYDVPKPLIPVNGVPMVVRAMRSIDLDGDYWFITQSEYWNQWGFSDKVGGGLTILVDELTDGATCTVLKARVFIDTDAPLFIADSDMILEWDSSDFVEFLNREKPDGVLLTYKSADPKNSFVRIENGLVVGVAEKTPISDNACVGCYYFKRGSDFVASAQAMIARNERTNNEFYIAPVYRELLRHKRIMPYPVKHWSISTPDDLRIYLEAHPV